MARPFGLVLAAPLCFMAPTGNVASAPGSVAGPGRFDGQLTRAAGSDLPYAEKLTRVLRDRMRPEEERADAAKELGRLRYGPAIPVLIDNVAMPAPRPWDSPIEFFHDDMGGGDGPCVRALRRFGQEVIAPIVKRYLSVNARSYERVCLRNALLGSNAHRSTEDVLDYIFTLRSTVTDPEDRAALTFLYRCVDRKGLRRHWLGEPGR